MGHNFHHEQSSILCLWSPIFDPLYPILNSWTSINDPQSSIRYPQSLNLNPWTIILNPLSSVLNPQSLILNLNPYLSFLSPQSKFCYRQPIFLNTYKLPIRNWFWSWCNVHYRVVNPWPGCHTNDPPKQRQYLCLGEDWHTGIVHDLGSKLKTDTFWQFLNIPIDQFKPIKEADKSNYFIYVLNTISESMELILDF